MGLEPTTRGLKGNHHLSAKGKWIDDGTRPLLFQLSYRYHLMHRLSPNTPKRLQDVFGDANYFLLSVVRHVWMMHNDGLFLHQRHDLIQFQQPVAVVVNAHIHALSQQWKRTVTVSM